MQFKHLNLATSDVIGLAAFFERFFGFNRLLERGSGALVILGAGSGGYACALRAAELGLSVVIAFVLIFEYMSTNVCDDLSVDVALAAA